MVWGGAATANAPDTQNATQVLWGAGAVADNAANPDGKPANPDADKMVCRSMDPPTGSRLGSRRECHTQAEWDERSREDQAKTNQIQEHGFQQNLPHG
jgi:hypothetical protein